MDFSDSLLQYTQKHYTPTSARIVPVLIILSIIVSITVGFSVNIETENPSFNELMIILLIIEVIIGFGVIVIIPSGRKNNGVEKIEKAIILNMSVINNYHPIDQKNSLIKIDSALAGNLFRRNKQKKELNDCLLFLDPYNKSNWAA